MTAEFNRNVLRVINVEPRRRPRPRAFDHVAFYDEHAPRIEMRLRARDAT